MINEFIWDPRFRHIDCNLAEWKNLPRQISPLRSK